MTRPPTTGLGSLVRALRPFLSRGDENPTRLALEVARCIPPGCEIRPTLRAVLIARMRRHGLRIGDLWDAVELGARAWERAWILSAGARLGSHTRSTEEKVNPTKGYDPGVRGDPVGHLGSDRCESTWDGVTRPIFD